jgi:hypothetical protein
MLKGLALFISAFAAFSASAGELSPNSNPIAAAENASQIQPGDSVQVRINKLLFLLNHNGYLYKNMPGTPPFQHLSRDEQQSIIQEFNRLAAGDPAVARTPDAKFH